MRLATGKAVATVRLGHGAWQAVVSPDGKDVYTADFADNMVDVITAARNAVTGEVDLHQNSYPVAIAAGGHFLFTADCASGTVSEYGIPDYQSVTEIPVGIAPDALALVPAS